MIFYSKPSFFISRVAMAILPGGPTGAPSSSLALLQNLNFHPYATHFSIKSIAKTALGKRENLFPSVKISDMIAFKDLLERSAFGVCSYLADKIGIATSRVRLYFIYATVATLGSPILFYLVGIFWLNLKKYIKNKPNLVRQ